MSGVLVDAHVKVLDAGVRRRAIERGVDAIVYAPHYTPWPDIVEQAERFSDDRLTVVPARELFAGGWRNRTHVLALDLASPVPDFLSLETTMRVLEDQGACVIAPHPTYLTMSLSAGDLSRYHAVIDAIEVYNPKLLPWHHRRARSLADRLDRPPVASSYAHLRTSVGAAGVRLAVEDPTPTAIVSALRAGDVSDVEVPTGGRRAYHSAVELAHLAWENSASRLRRLAETVPTHPTAELYGDRFEASSG